MASSLFRSFMMVVVTRLSVMGRFSARPTLTFFGWAGTALMAVTVVDCSGPRLADSSSHRESIISDGEADLIEGNSFCRTRMTNRQKH
jgi:hypothetical protein